MLLAIHGLDMPHQGRKDANIGVAVGIGEDAEQFDASAASHLGAGSARNPFHPVGRIAGEAVFPASEPQKHEAHVVTTRALDDAIEHAEVELPRLWLTWFQETPASTVLTFDATSLGHTSFMYSTLVAVLLLSSPDKARNGCLDDQLGGRPLLAQVRDAGSAARARGHMRAAKNKFEVSWRSPWRLPVAVQGEVLYAHVAVRDSIGGMTPQDRFCPCPVSSPRAGGWEPNGRR